MPTYEYECKQCNHHFEVFQSMSEEPLNACPQCGKDVRRLIFGGAGVIFRGSGFYVTDKGKGKDGKTPAVAAKKAEPSSTAAQDAPASSKTGGSETPAVSTENRAAAANAETNTGGKTGAKTA
ncbi:MAG: hypothetical protein LBG95_01630 [Treponema sp.]|jgi:putative FmdB family regulatory protein|nr:hypothetical protein [Treponema sp.]